MIRHRLPRLLASRLGLVDHLLEVAPLRVAQQFLQLTGQPVLQLFILVRAVFKALVQFLDELFFYVAAPLVLSVVFQRREVELIDADFTGQPNNLLSLYECVH
jgi:hypothetical protein